MRIALLVTVLSAIVLSPAASPAAKSHVLRANGLAVVAPPSWHLARQQVTECTSPTQVMAATDVRRPLRIGAKIPRERTLILILEDKGYQGNGFPPRTRFRLPGLGAMGGCCEMPYSRGFELVFRDHGRNLYAFVYAATRENANRAVGVLNTLDVR
jgi:hypothetical protein